MRNRLYLLYNINILYSMWQFYSTYIGGSLMLLPLYEEDLLYIVLFHVILYIHWRMPCTWRHLRIVWSDRGLSLGSTTRHITGPYSHLGSLWRLFLVVCLVVCPGWVHRSVHAVIQRTRHSLCLRRTWYISVGSWSISRYWNAKFLIVRYIFQFHFMR